MIKRDRSSWFVLGAAVLVMVGALGLLVASLVEEPLVEDTQPVRQTPNSSSLSDGNVQQEKTRIPIESESFVRIPKQPREAHGRNTNAVTSVAVKDDDTDALMEEVVKEILAQLQDARKRRDVKGILALAAKLRSLRYGAKAGGGRGSVSVKRALLGALAGCGVEAIPEIVNLVNDPDVAIAQEATSLIFETLRDSSMSDSVRADIVVEAASEMENVNSIIRLYNEFIKMRHSVGVDAFVRISSEGTAEARAQLPRVISAFTGNPSITTADQLNDWLPNHPDGKDDNKRYGGIKRQGAQTE